MILYSVEELSIKTDLFIAFNKYSRIIIIIMSQHHTSFLYTYLLRIFFELVYDFYLKKKENKLNCRGKAKTTCSCKRI